MRVKIAHDDLAKGVASAARAAGSSATLFAISGILVEAEGENVTFRATNLEISTTVTVPAAVEEAGKILLPAKLLSDVARSLPGSTATLSIDNDRAIIDAGEAHFELRTIPVEEFPNLPEIGKDAKTVELRSSDFNRVVAQTLPAASKDDARPILTGVDIDFASHTMTAASTDSYRLAVRKSKVRTNTKVHALVPARALQEAIRLTKDVDEVKVSIEGSQIAFQVEGATLIARLLEGKFPDYAQLIPNGHETEVVANRKELLEIVNRIAVVAPDQPVTLDIKDGSIEIESAAADVGKGEEPIDVQTTGKALKIAFNPRYLLDGLKAVNGTNVRVQMRDELKPAVLLPVEEATDDPDDTPDPVEDYLYLLMPVRV